MITPSKFNFRKKYIVGTEKNQFHNVIAWMISSWYLFDEYSNRLGGEADISNGNHLFYSNLKPNVLKE